MILKQRVVIGADSVWPLTPTRRFIEHAAQCRAIDTTDMHSEANNPAGVLIHNHHYPVGLRSNGFGTQ
jgi:hypothetical protein